MSTSEEIPLQTVSDKAVEDGKHLDSQEQIASRGTSSSTKETAAPSRWKKIFTTIATLIAYSFLNAGISMIAPFYPIVAKQQYNVAVYYSGLVLGMAPLWVTLTSPLIGYLLPHLGLKFTQLAGLLLAGGTLILFGFVAMMSTAALFLAFSFMLRIVSGIGIAMFSTASYTLLTQFFTTKKGSIVSAMEFSLILGYAAGPILGGGLQEAGGFLLPFLVVGGCTVALMFFLMVVLPSTECTSVKMSWRLLLKLFTNIVFVLIVAILVVVMTVFCATFAYFGQFIHKQYHLNFGLVGVAYSSLTITYAVGTILTGPVTDRLKKPRYFIIAGILIAVVGFEFIGPAELITTPKIWLSVIAGLILGIGAALAVVPVYPDIFGIAIKLHEEEEAIASVLSGILVAAISAGEAFGPIVGGAIVYKVGFPNMAAILGLIALACAIVLITVTVIQKVCTSVEYRKFNKSDKL